jgi:hypothetical protein
MTDTARRNDPPPTVRHVDEMEWETIRWPGETGKMLFHPTPERPTTPNAGLLNTKTGGTMVIVQYPGPSTGGRPIYDKRFNMAERRAVAEERTDV